MNIFIQIAQDVVLVAGPYCLPECMGIIELVDSIGRDSADTQYMTIPKKSLKSQKQ